MAGQQDVTLRVAIDPVLVRSAGRALLATGQTIADAAAVLERQNREGARLRAGLLEIRRLIRCDQEMRGPSVEAIEAAIERALVAD